MNHPSESLFWRVSLGQSVFACRLGFAAFAFSAFLSPLFAWRFIEFATSNPYRTLDAIAVVACLLFFTWEVRLFTAGRPVAFHWLMPEATSRATFARWLNFCIDVTMICFLLFYLAAGSR